MNSYNPVVARLNIPARIRKLKISDQGYPVPKFVQWYDGKPDFRVVNRAFMANAVRIKLCWLCGEALGRYQTFAIGPMCCINRVTSEPPSHLDCARFAVQACPFLTQPNRRRNEEELPEGAMSGIGILRNPGVCLIWVTESYKPFKAPGGTLFQIGEPTSLEWYARGRVATRAEIMDSIATGLPTLIDMAKQDGPEAMAALDRYIKRGLALVPA